MMLLWSKRAAALLVATLAPLCTASPLLPLVANFDDQPPGTPIGVGGASLGEPVDTAGLTATVTQIAPTQNVLSVVNQSDTTSARRLHWQLLDNAGVGRGTLVYAFTFVPGARDGYSFLVREPDGAAQSFLNITLAATGRITADDEAGTISVPTTFYTAGEAQRWVLAFDLEAGTSSVFLNDVALIQDRAHGISGESIGRLYIGYSAFAAGSSFQLDDLHAMHVQRDQLLLNADIEDSPLGAPIGTGGAVLGEPVAISTRLLTEVGSDGADGRWLRYASIDASTANSITWQFSNNTEVTTGRLFVSWDMRLPALDGYAYSFREAGSSAQSFPSLRLGSSGRVDLVESGGVVVATDVSYVANRTYRVRFAFDFSSHTYDALLDNRILTAGRPFGISTSRGIGRFLTTILNLSAINQPVILDNIEVRTEASFRDGFEAP
jgi:hypothetical protein